ncbi:MAG: flavodoxin family protein [Chloroflexi bacterium]|nr:flavodoxin family protein [Chloroflexota bacterium]
MNMEITLLGVCGSPVKEGNTEAFLHEALREAGAQPGVSTSEILLARKKIGDCRHCNWCLVKQEKGRFCAIEDDMTEIYPRLIEADALLLSTPTYAGRLSGYMATFMDRWRALVLGKHYRGALEGKVGGAMTVAWLRNAGPETALLSVVTALLMWGVVVVTPGESGCQFGAVGLSSSGGTGRFDPKDRLGVLQDEAGLKSARALARRMVRMSRTLKAGRQALGQSG